MFHISNLGPRGEAVARFADIDGYIPQPGDRPEEFTWDVPVEWTAQSWRAFTTAADIAIYEATEGQE